MTEQQAPDVAEQQLWPCPKCQTPISTDSQFCPKCGHQLSNAPTEPAGKKKATPGETLLGLLMLGALVVGAMWLFNLGPFAPSTGDGDWQAFTEHVGGSASNFSSLSAEIVAAANAENVSALRTSVSRALRATETELTWLRTNPPTACYRAVHEGWRQAMLKYQEAFTAIDYGLRPPVTANDVERGTALMQEGTELVRTANLLLTTTDC